MSFNKSSDAICSHHQQRLSFLIPDFVEPVKYYLKEDSVKTDTREETIDDWRQVHAASRAGGEAEAERPPHGPGGQWSEIHSLDIELEW